MVFGLGLNLVFAKKKIKHHKPLKKVFSEEIEVLQLSVCERAYIVVLIYKQ